MNNGSAIQRNKKSKLDAIFVMVVFMLFVCCLLLVTLAFARVYKSSSEKINNRFDNSTAVSFIMKNLRSYDKVDSISVTEYEGKNVLCLYETIENSEYVTYIYQNDGMLCELFADSHYPFSAEDGEILLPCESFSIDIKDNIVSFSVTSGGKVTDQRYFLRSDAERTV